MAVDGSLKFDTKLNDSGLSDGINKLSSMAAKGLAAITGSVAGMSTYAIKVGSDFEAGMSKVAAISGASADELEMLTEKAKEMGIQTKFSATEASEALQYMAMAGWKASDMADGISGIMNLAAASGEDLASVSDIVTDALTAFGLEAKDSAHFADVLAKAASNSNTNVGMMGGTFQYVAPVAGALGYSVEDTAVAIGLMANSGIKAEKAGTALRSMLSRLIKPTDETAGVMEKLGITIANSDGTVKPFSQTMKELRSTFADLTDEEKAQYAASLAGQEAMSGFLAIVNASESDFEKLSDAIAHADGTAEEMAKTMNDNLKGKITLLGSSLEGVGIAAYDKFERPLKKAVEGAIDKVNDLSKEMSSGELSKSMEKVAEGLSSVIDTALDLAADAIPLLINGFAFVVDHGREVVTVMTAIGTAMITQKTVVPVVNAFRATIAAVDAYNVRLLACTASGIIFKEKMTLGQAVVGLFAGKVTLATAATTAWNAACSALGGPIGVAITAVAALAGGLTVLAMTMRDTSDIEKHREAIENAKVAYDDLNKSKDEMLSSSMESVNHYETLKEKLEMIVDSSGRVKKGYEGLAAYIVEDLNGALDMNMQIVDGQILKYDEASAKMDEYIAKMRASAIIEAQEEQMKKAQTLYDENNKEIARIDQEMGVKKEEYIARLAELESRKASQEEVASDATLNMLSAEMGAYEQQKSELLNVQTGILNDQQTYYDNVGKFQEGGVENLKAINASEIAEYNEQGERIEKTLQEQYEEINADIAAHEAAISETTDKAQKQRLTDELNDLKKQREEKGKEMELEQTTTKKHFEELTNTWITATKEIVAKADVTKALEQSGEYAAEGYARGMTLPSVLGKVSEAAGKMVQTAIEAANKKQKAHSPARVFRDDVGLWSGAGYALGLVDSQGLIKKSARGMVQCAIDESSKLHDQLQDNFKGDFSGSFSFMRNAAVQNVSSFPASTSGDAYNNHLTDKSESIDYDRLTSAVKKGMEGMSVKVNNREMGRLVKEW